jgi:ribosomal protein L37AE/L43A
MDVTEGPKDPFTKLRQRVRQLELDITRAIGERADDGAESDFPDLDERARLLIADIKSIPDTVTTRPIPPGGEVPKVPTTKPDLIDRVQAALKKLDAVWEDEDTRRCPQCGARAVTRVLGASAAAPEGKVSRLDPWECGTCGRGFEGPPK